MASLLDSVVNTAFGIVPPDIAETNLAPILGNLNLPLHLNTAISSTPLYDLLFAALLLSLQSDPNAPKTKTMFKNRYDYIIVGAGSAGATLAARLSEIPCVSVLLLEFGPKAPTLNDVPFLSRTFVRTNLDWQFKTVPQQKSGSGFTDRQVVWPAGKGLGGSSLINAMLFVRGNHKDYDRWAANGATGWSYNEVLKYFLKLEGNRDLSGPFHNTTGPVDCEFVRYDAPILKPLNETLQNLGYNIVDSNAETQSGWNRLQSTTRRGQRCSTAKAYLVPAENRENLDIVSLVYVKKVLIRNSRAVGVVVQYNGRQHRIYASREVIISAGATKTPQILMLSGIGPRAHLENFGIPVHADLPGVGENLQDHPAPFLNYELTNSRPIFNRALDPGNMLLYIRKREGVLTAPEGVSSISFLRGTDTNQTGDSPLFENYIFEYPTGYPEIENQIGITNEVYKKVFQPYLFKATMFCASSLLRPFSRGTIKLRSPNPYHHPLIDPNFFDDERDIKNAVDGLKVCRKLAASESLKQFGMQEFKVQSPDCEGLENDEDRFLECLTTSYYISLSHYSGTAKMGSSDDPMAVVDPQLRVIGIDGLRVVDASVFPDVPSGNTNVPTIMAAEKAADMIKETIQCSYEY